MHNAIATADRLEVASGYACFCSNVNTVSCVASHATRKSRLANRREQIEFRYGVVRPQERNAPTTSAGKRSLREPQRVSSQSSFALLRHMHTAYREYLTSRNSSGTSCPEPGVKVGALFDHGGGRVVTPRPRLGSRPPLQAFVLPSKLKWPFLPQCEQRWRQGVGRRAVLWGGRVARPAGIGWGKSAPIARVHANDDYGHTCLSM